MLTAGIDFGTTNSSIGYNDGINAKLVKLYKGGYTDRTSIFYSFENNGIPIVGEEGYQEVLLGERGRHITSTKKFLSKENISDIQILHQKYSLVDIISILSSLLKKNWKMKLEKKLTQYLSEDQYISMIQMLNLIYLLKTGYEKPFSRLVLKM